MSNYLIDSMVWSYSRLNCFLQCPYQFYLKYIEQVEEAPMFFSEYGSLIHSIVADYHRGSVLGNVSSDDAFNSFLIRFPTEAVGAFPSQDIRDSYFKSGIDAMKALSPVEGLILGVEEEVSFTINDMPFVGFVDLVYADADGAVCIVDHKSRNLKPRSGRKNPTRTDAELDEYLRQLYIYSIGVQAKYCSSPDFLEFNCYRSGTRIRERFCSAEQSRVALWALETIQRIRDERAWKPNLDYWRCNYLCGASPSCEYKAMCDWH